MDTKVKPKESHSLKARTEKMDPLTDDDKIVYIDLGVKPLKCLMVEDFLMFLDENDPGPDMRKHVPALKNMEMDKDDVIICGASKSGTHWLLEITHMLLLGKAEYQDKNSKGRSMMELASIDDLKALPKPRIYNTHSTFSHLPRQVLEKHCKIIFIQRNPKDVMVSLLPFLQGFELIDPTVTWEEFFNKYIALETEASILNWFYYTRSWYNVIKDKPDNIYSVYFEDLKEDTEKEIANIARFLNLPQNDGLFKEIAEKCNFSNLKEAKDGHFIYRKGQVGDWKNFFTVAQNEQFDKVYASIMNGVDFQYRYSL